MATNRKTKKAAKAATPAKRVAPASGKAYTRNFLDTVLVRLDFATPFPESVQKEFAKRMKPLFPIPEERKETKGFSISADGLKAQEQTSWFYNDRSSTKSLHLGPDALFIEYKKYESYQILKTDFLAAANAAFGLVPAIQAKRLGLRYVDKIEVKDGQPTQWETYLSPKLLKAFSLADDQDTISRILTVLEFQYDDGMRMKFQFGMPNPDFPAQIRQKQFVLDYDAFCSQLLELDDLEAMLDKFHGKISRSFEEVITDGLRKLMRK